MVRTNRILKVISTFLCVLIAVLMPVQVCSEVVGSEKEELPADFSNISSDVETVGNIVSEITGERTEYSKTFLLDDCTTMIAEYAQPVHYQNDKGKWVEYNNSLKAENSTATADEVSAEEYTNKSSDIDVKLSNKAKSNNMIKIASDDYPIGWGYDNANKSKAKIIKDDTKLSGNDKFTTLKNLTSETLYEDVLKNVDLQYFVTSTGVKENIVLNNKDAKSEFDIKYNIGKLRAKQKVDNAIDLYNGNDVVYTITAPYMFDANQKVSDKLKLEIINHDGSTLDVKLTADKGFLASSDVKYPVTIDPEISSGTSKNYSYNSYGTSPTKYNPPYNLSSAEYFRWKINTLPTLTSSQRIISATYNYSVGSISGTVSEQNPIIINLHNYSSTSPYYTSTVEDYYAVTSAEDEISFDITSLMKKWISGEITNNGFVLESKNTIGTRKLTLSSGDTTHSYPAYTVVYKDFTGKDDSQSYHTVSAGSRAELSVNDYLGNAVVTQNFYESKSARMPLLLSATYNSFDYAENYQDSMIGYGWNFSFNQYIEKITNSSLISAGYEYVYIESDRTKHYLKKNSDNSWEDDDALGLVLTKSNNMFYLEKDSEKLTFQINSAGRGILSYICEQDNTNNRIGYGRNSSDGFVNYIYDSTNQTQATFTTITINSKKYISTISLPNSRKVYLTYSQTGGKVLLSKVKLPDNSCSNYTYDSLGRLNSVKYTSENGSEVKNGSTVSLTYNSNNRVTNITEKGSNNTVGDYLNFVYGTDNTTKVTDRKGVSETYIFDNDGGKISTLNANGFASESESSGLTVSASADSYTKNYLEETSDFTNIGNYYSSRNSGTYSLDTTTKYFGTNSLKIYNQENNDSDSILYHQISNGVFQGKTVTFSSYVKTKLDNNQSNGIVQLAVQYDNNSQTKVVDGMIMEDEFSWKRISVTAQIPSTATNVQVLCKSKGTGYTAWFDCLQLEEGSAVNDYNALKSSDFASADNWLNAQNNAFSFTSGRPYIYGKQGVANSDVVGDDSDGDDTEDIEDSTEPSAVESTTTVTEHDVVDTTDAYGNVVKSVEGEYNRVYKVINSSDTDDTDTPTDDTTTDDNTNNLSNSYIYQRVNVNAKNVSFLLSGQALGYSVPLTNENRTFGIALNVYYKNSTVPESHYQEFNPSTTAKQSVSLSVTPEISENEVEYVDFAFVYGCNSNSMLVYNAMLNIAVTPEVTSNDNGNTQGTTSSDDNSDVEYGDMVSETLDTSKQYIKTNTTYNDKGTYVASETDELGVTTNYTYDADGNRNSVTDGNGNQTTYTYNSSGNVTSVVTGNASNDYTYDYRNNVDTISHNNFSYNFNYNEYNKLVSTYVGDSPIVTNTYTGSYGDLQKVAYANGDVIAYTYDSYNNVKTIKCNNELIATFIYNKKGLISKCEDSESGETTYYDYDCDGSLLNQYIVGENDNIAKSITRDENGNTVEKTSIGNAVRTVTTGTDTNGKTFVDYNGLTSTSESDEFGRTTSVTTKGFAGNKDYIVEYGYANGTGTNSTTKKVSSLTQTFDTTEVAKYEYSYDQNGNITQIKENGQVTNKYVYDSNNQLAKEYDYKNNFFIIYSLDLNGNIHSKNQQGLDTDGQPTGSPRGNVYYYQDTEWCDKLTRVNNSNITYDKIGNPLNYRDGMTFAWKNGRLLESTTLSDDTQITYKYNANGMRTEKKVGSQVTNYYYDSNNNLIGLKTGSNTLYFYYDTDNSPVAMSYNGEMYYYVKNIQGDITKIVNTSGVVYGTYTYDAWGNIVSSTGDPFVSRTNPLRYRGYVYDTDTKLYYLQSRYYDPFTGRFINADDTAYIGATGTTLSTNIFTYCENNPVNDVDKKGTDPTNIYLRYYYNCYAYAMGYTDRWLHPGKGNINVAINHTQRNPQGELKSEKYLLPTAYSVYKIRDWVEKDFGKIVRKISGRNSNIKKNEYRIAFRVQRMVGPLQKGQKRQTYDFHFMKQDPKTKKWYDKPGSTAVRSLGKINPNKNSSWSNKYNSKTLYMAVKKKFKK